MQGLSYPKSESPDWQFLLPVWILSYASAFGIQRTSGLIKMKTMSMSPQMVSKEGGWSCLWPRFWILSSFVLYELYYIQILLFDGHSYYILKLREGKIYSTNCTTYFSLNFTSGKSILCPGLESLITHVLNNTKYHRKDYTDLVCMA